MSIKLDCKLVVVVVDSSINHNEFENIRSAYKSLIDQSLNFKINFYIPSVFLTIIFWLFIYIKKVI